MKFIYLSIYLRRRDGADRVMCMDRGTLLCVLCAPLEALRYPPLRRGGKFRKTLVERSSVLLEYFYFPLYSHCIPLYPAVSRCIPLYPAVSVSRCIPHIPLYYTPVPRCILLHPAIFRPLPRPGTPGGRAFLLLWVWNRSFYLSWPVPGDGPFLCLRI